VAKQPFTITGTYDRSTRKLTCNPKVIHVPNGTTGSITVNLKLSTGATGSIVFGNPPFNWSSGPPTGTTVAPLTGGTAQEVITETNSNPTTKSYDFTVNYTYTPSGGSPVYGTGDPTIINDGTGGSPEGDQGEDENDGDQG
jgi:hypothetical protein